jgi:hypothetical protein
MEPGRADAAVDPLADGSLPDRDVEQALRNFRLSVHAWSDAAYSRPRTAPSVYRHRVWRLALGWTLGCVLIAGAVTAGVHQMLLPHGQARQAAAAAVEHRQQNEARTPPAGQVSLAGSAKAEEDDDRMLASVDNDVSRQVPAAMEALTSLASEDDPE